MAIAWRVDELASRRGWGVRELATAAGIDRKTARKILRGSATRVDLATIDKLSQALGVAPGDLWTTPPDRAEAWQRTAGAAGGGTGEEIEAALRGDWDGMPEPALERAAHTR